MTRDGYEWTPDRDDLGRKVREAWVHWARQQPNSKPSWLVPYDDLSEADKEADRQIGEALTAELYELGEGLEKWGDEQAARADAAEAQLNALPMKLVGYGRDAGRLVRVEVLDGTERVDLFRPNSAAQSIPAAFAEASLATARADGIEVERLREALKPFANMLPDTFSTKDALQAKLQEWCRRARAALSPLANEPAKDETEVTG